MRLILRYLRTVFAEPIRDLRSMLDAGQPTNDIDMMVHAIERLRETGETRPGGLAEGSSAGHGHEADAGAMSSGPLASVSQARLIRDPSPSRSQSGSNRQDAPGS